MAGRADLALTVSFVDAGIACGGNVAGVTGEMALACVTVVGDTTRAIEGAPAPRAVDRRPWHRAGAARRPPRGAAADRLVAEAEPAR